MGLQEQLMKMRQDNDVEVRDRVKTALFHFEGKDSGNNSMDVEGGRLY
jgi:hypothetical protein